MRKETKVIKEELARYRRKYAGRLWRGNDQSTCDVIKYLVHFTMYAYVPNQTPAYRRYFKEFYIWLIKECNNIGFNSFIRYEMYKYRYMLGDLLYLLDHDDRIQNILFIGKVYRK